MVRGIALHTQKDPKGSFCVIRWALRDNIRTQWSDHQFHERLEAIKKLQARFGLEPDRKAA